jgi:glucose-6-phosphate 1-epimerase
MSTEPPVARNALVAGGGGMEKIVLVARDGARVETYLHGAHVTSWHPSGAADDRLYLSPLAHFAPGTSIRGGVPVCFPQFADQGTLPMHGFARDMAWELVAAGLDGTGAAQARLRLADSPATRALWPHAFACEITVTASGPSLTVELAVTNTGTDSFAFTTALHSYLRVADVRRVRVEGLAGARYRDKNLRQNDVAEIQQAIAVDRPLDRVYHVVPDAVVVREPHRGLRVHASGTTDTVVWNPGPQDAPAGDLPADGWRSFLCVEAAVASTSTTLAPGQRWQGAQTLTALEGNP